MTTKNKRTGKLRVSSDPSDAGYKTWLETFGGCCNVTFNGVDLGDTAITADEETGEVTVVKVDQYGAVVMEDGAPVAVKLQGVVTIRKCEPTP